MFEVERFSDFLMFFIVLAIAVGLVLILLVVISTFRRKGNFGINLEKVTCFNCGTVAPQVRRPKNLRQALWGGWTCECGTELDKWGAQV